MAVFIQARHDGFRRCGEVHTREGRNFPDGYFTDEQLKQLNCDPEIVMVAGVEEDVQVLELERQDINPDDDAGTGTVSDMAKAAGQAIAAGDTTGTGAPKVEAMEAILGVNITADQRDAAWTEWRDGNKS